MFVGCFKLPANGIGVCRRAELNYVINLINLAQVKE